MEQTEEVNIKLPKKIVETITKRVSSLLGIEIPKKKVVLKILEDYIAAEKK